MTESSNVLHQSAREVLYRRISESACARFVEELIKIDANAVEVLEVVLVKPKLPEPWFHRIFYKDNRGKTLYFGIPIIQPKSAKT